MRRPLSVLCCVLPVALLPSLQTVLLLTLCCAAPQATEIDANLLSLCIQEPLGVVGSIIPWNFPRESALSRPLPP